MRDILYTLNKTKSIKLASYFWVQSSFLSSQGNKFKNKKIKISFYIKKNYIFASKELKMFSKSCEYAIKAMIFVAQKSNNDSKVGLKEIAHGTDTPVSFMAKIMQELSKKKLVQSCKGPNGGFYLNKKNLKTSIADIVLATDGDGIYTKCVLGLKNCNEKTPCPIHDEYKDIKKKFITMLEKNTIIDFNKKLMANKFFLKNDDN